MAAWQGLWNQEANSQVGYAFLVNKNPRRNAMRRSVNRDSFRVITALFNALIGAASGGATGAITHKRVGAITTTQIGDGGGLRTIETITDINRVTTAADVTKLKEMVYGVKTAPASYPANLAGNGIK